MSAKRYGVWLVGGRGAVATCAVLGAALLRKRCIEPWGMVSAHPFLSHLGLLDLDALVFAGHEIREGSAFSSAQSLLEHRVLREDHLREGRESLEIYDRQLRRGIVGETGGEAAIAALQNDWQEFLVREKLDGLVVVNLASTEAYRDLPESWASLEGFRKDLRAAKPIPTSVLYAYAVLDAGHPYINFTPSPGASPGALQQLALEKCVPHAGRDGKTGETLLKTALAPMFRARHFEVMSWQGYNMLGNGDGKTLADPAHRESKLRSKDEGLRRILDNPDLHSKVSIDYVPSLDDWKTAWDFVHFRGFLDVPMTFQFTWSGSDSALAAPLVLDLVRLAEFAKRKGEAGVMTHTASFFKAPLGCAEQDFHKQFAMLESYAARHANTRA